MTIERLLEAAKRLQDRLHPFSWIAMNVTESHVHDKHGYALRDRGGSIRVHHYRAGQTNHEITVGYAEIDVNGIVLSIKYDDSAPWWAVQPFIDAMAGK